MIEVPGSTVTWWPTEPNILVPSAWILRAKEASSATPSPPFSCLLLSFPAAAAKLLQSFLTLCDPIDSSPLGSPVPGILQARTLEWVDISFSNA